MAEKAERAFAKTFLNTLSTQPITYADDYQQPSQYSLKRVPVLPVSFLSLAFGSGELRTYISQFSCRF